MRPFLSILVSLHILLSGMHYTVATHLCGGEIAAIKVSFTGIKASCGMESDKNNRNSAQTGFNSHCCDDRLSVYSADITFAPAEGFFKNLSNKFVAPFHLPADFQQFHNSHTFPDHAYKPPGNLFASAVSITDICIFRI